MWWELVVVIRPGLDLSLRRLMEPVDTVRTIWSHPQTRSIMPLIIYLGNSPVAARMRPEFRFDECLGRPIRPTWSTHPR